MSNSWYLGTEQSSRVGTWDRSTPQNPFRLQMDGTLSMRDDICKEIRDNLAITDAKSLYDALEGMTKGKEPRVALAVAEIKQGMAAVKTTILKMVSLPNNWQFPKLTLYTVPKMTKL